jgi:fructose-1,6-bisphosphatase/inositol monophosphatase family enzyme
MPLDTISDMVEHVKMAGQHALHSQSRRPVEKKFKEDGSVVTALDREVEGFLAEKITELYPDANIIGEEVSRELLTDREFIFLLDPIDGTDAFSQGMPSWCVSIGLLNAEFEPVAGILYAPALELMLFADLGQRATVNNQVIEVDKNLNHIDSTTNIMVPSSAHQYLNLQQYKGKARSMGSAALHLCYPLIYPRVFAAIESKGTHAWDIAGAHAINRSVGCYIEFIDGRKIDYRLLLEGQPVGNFILSGTKERIAALKLLIKIL